MISREREQAISRLSEEDQRSINILYNIQNCERFYADDENVHFKNPNETFPIDDFLKAVDYYYDNRDLELVVNLAMREKDGVVKVYAPYVQGAEERPVILTIKNYMVPQILEFAYLLTRREM